MKYQQRNYDLKLQETHYEVGDFVYRLNGASKTGESKKLKPVWVGPLVVTDVLNPILFRVKDCKKEYVLHHNHLKLCEDCHIPLWLHKPHHSLLDLDTTIAYDEAEQEDLSPPSVPKLNVEDSQSPLSEDAAPEDVAVSSTPACSSPAGLDASVPSWDSESQSHGGISEDIDIPHTDLVHDNASTGDTAIGLSPDSALSDNQTKDASDLLLMADDLHLNTLCDIHVHAQRHPAPKPQKGKPRRASPLPSASPAESISKTGQPQKAPSYLRDYTH